MWVRLSPSSLCPSTSPGPFARRGGVRSASCSSGCALSARHLERGSQKPAILPQERNSPSYQPPFECLAPPVMGGQDLQKAVLQWVGALGRHVCVCVPSSSSAQGAPTGSYSQLPLPMLQLCSLGLKKPLSGQGFVLNQHKLMQRGNGDPRAPLQVHTYGLEGSSSRKGRFPLTPQGCILQHAEPGPFPLRAWRQAERKKASSSLLLLLMARPPSPPRPRGAVPEDHQEPPGASPRRWLTGCPRPGAAPVLRELGKMQALAPSSDAGCGPLGGGLPGQALSQPAPKTPR